MNEKQPEALTADFSDAGTSSRMMVSTLAEWYDAKHRETSAEEIAFIDSVGVGSCPYCGSEEIGKDGFERSGVRCFECRSCGSEFSTLAGAIFDSRKMPISEWIEYLAHLFEFRSVRTSSSDNRNADPTGRYWLSKVFLVLRLYQNDVVLSGRVWADETYVPKWRSKRVTAKGKELRGLSRNQHSICTLTDGRLCYLLACGTGKPNGPKSMMAHSDRIEVGSASVRGGEMAHNPVIGSLGLVRETHKAQETKGLRDFENPMNEINSVHRVLKRFLSRHGAYSRDDLRDWLSLFAFIWDTPGNKCQKAQAFIEMAIKMRDKLRYFERSKTENVE